LTNRELFFLLKSKKENDYVSDSLIYNILIYVNKYKDFTELILNFDNEIKVTNKVKKIFNRVNKGEPFEYIINEYKIQNLTLYINKNVLIPREETIELVNKSIDFLEKEKDKNLLGCDLCTGSGIIALLIKEKFKNFKMYATDNRKKALNVARKNATKNNLEITFLLGNRVLPLIKNNIKLDFLISNPPYVDDLKTIDKNVMDYEPLSSIYTKHGLRFYINIFKNYKKIMNDHFYIFLETNFNQKKDLEVLVKKYFDENNINYYFIKDFYGKDRFLIIEGDKWFIIQKKISIKFLKIF